MDVTEDIRYCFVAASGDVYHDTIVLVDQNSAGRYHGNHVKFIYNGGQLSREFGTQWFTVRGGLKA